MASENKKPFVGRQNKMPLSRAFKISLNSLKIRFSRSIITSAGIFLGIAFLTTVLTQSLMQWPQLEKVDVGHVKVDGEVNGPGEFSAWSPVSVEDAIAIGIPSEAIEMLNVDQGKIDISEIVKLRKEYDDAVKTIERLKSEQSQLAKLDKSLFKNPDDDITVNNAVKAGVPQPIAKKLAGDAQVFKISVLKDEISAYLLRIKRAQKKKDELSVFNNIDANVINNLKSKYIRTVADVLALAKDPTEKSADLNQLMIVNANGRQIKLDLVKNSELAQKTSIEPGDYVFIPDKNSRYRLYWLAIMALLVCTVGITNAMLMSVTERFKEIGTMKCLGALDRFVVILFLLESGMMGIVASILGWFVGFTLIIISAWRTRGWEVVASISPIQVLYLFLVSVGIGMLITLIATIAPAKRAAEMPPAMALRTEI
ncbi:MAG: FtsX-like permease family protein [Armatimonadota bacterium]